MPLKMARGCHAKRCGKAVKTAGSSGRSLRQVRISAETITCTLPRELSAHRRPAREPLVRHHRFPAGAGQRHQFVRPGCTLEGGIAGIPGAPSGVRRMTVSASVGAISLRTACTSSAPITGESPPARSPVRAVRGDLHDVDARSVGRDQMGNGVGRQPSSNSRRASAIARPMSRDAAAGQRRRRGPARRPACCCSFDSSVSVTRSATARAVVNFAPATLSSPRRHPRRDRGSARALRAPTRSPRTDRRARRRGARA